MSVPFNIGVLQLSMEPVQETAAMARASEAAGFDAFWIAEGEAVARKLGIELHGDPRQLVQKGANAPGKHRASMLQDVLARRQTEVDFMNGAISQWGDKVGVATPLNKVLWELIKGLEYSWRDPD